MFKFTGLTILLLIVFAVNSNAQQSVSDNKSNFSRLNIDFEVKDNPYPDFNLVNSINLDNYENFRDKEKRTVVKDIPTGYFLILYSQKETDLNRAIQSPVKKFQSAANPKFEKASK